MSPLVLFGAGGHARVVLDAARAAGMRVDWVIDDDPHDSALDGVPVVGASDERWMGLGAFRFVVTIGRNPSRAEVFARLESRGGTAVSVVHPAAVISPGAGLGSGTVVMAGVVVNAGARVGKNCILNTGCSIDHECLLGDHVHVCPGVHVAGRVSVGTGTMLGIGSCVTQCLTIGAWTTVGAGAVVVRDVPGGVVVYGNPARVRRTA